jgi:hypothetical protein
MRFTHRPRCDYTVTDRKRAAALRLQRRQRDSLPLLAPLIAETQPSIDEVMNARVSNWIVTMQRDRDRRAASWRRARRAIEEHEPALRRALLTYWNSHRWLPGDPSYLLDMLHGYETGRLVADGGQIRPARIVIPVSEAAAAFGKPKPVSGGWLSATASSAHHPGKAVNRRTA